MCRICKIIRWLVKNTWLKYCVKTNEDLIFTLYIDSITIKSKFMQAELTTVQKINGQVTPKNKLGQPAPVETGTVSFASDNPDIADVVEDPNDETKFTIVGKGEGTTKIKFQADADRGEGVTTITGEIDVTVLPAAASGFGVELSPAEDQA